MREATETLQTLEQIASEYCKVILNAESPEEIANIKESIAPTFREYGFDEEYIENFTDLVDKQLVAVQTGQLVFNDKGQLVSPSEYAEQITGQEQNANIQREADAKAAAGFGLAAAAIVASLAIKQAVLKHQKNKTK